MAEMIINFGKTIGKIKRVNGVGQPPIVGAAYDPLFHFLTEANIPYSRLHDTGGTFGGGRFVDIPNLFPNFDADENDPANYFFQYTDWLLEALDKAGVEPYFRLGVSIENIVDRYASPRLFPPKDCEKWARICEHVIRHYTEGWANGYHLKIDYWEIWNEPDNSHELKWNAMWQGSDVDYYRLYEVTARHLKTCFPHLKIGGYANSGFYAITEGDSDPRKKYFVDFFIGFLKWITSEEHKAPIDFFSWHSYDTIENTMVQADYCRKTLDQYGLKDIEIHLNEWNPSPRVLGLMQHAAYVGGMLLMYQNAPIDVSCFYDARIGISEYGSFFNPITRQTFADYDAFVMFGRLLKLGRQVELCCDQKGVYAVAATDGAQKGAMIVNTLDAPCAIDLTASGADLSAAVCEETSRYKRMEKGDLIRENRLYLGGESMVYITL